jgi:ABC-type cobalamin transport system ATPase subunit
MTRIQEQQNVIISLNRRVNDLEKKTGQHVTQIATLVASVAAASAAVEESEKKVTKSFQYDLQKLDQKTTKKANDITTELRSGVTKLTRSVQELATREQDRTRAERERAAAAAAASGRR